MRIAVIEREFPPAAVSAGAVSLQRIAQTLADMGHEVHIIAQSVWRLSGFEERGRLMIHRVRLPSPTVDRRRILLDFAVEAARRVLDIHASGGLDVAEFSTSDSPGVAMSLFRALGGADGLAIIVRAPAAPRDQAAPSCLEMFTQTIACNVIDWSLPAPDRIAVYRSALGATPARASIRPRLLPAWGGAQSAAAAFAPAAPTAAMCAPVVSQEAYR